MVFLACFVWLAASCGDFSLFEDGEEGPCDGDPCEEIDHATAGSCQAVGTDDFTCNCEGEFTWAGASNTCQEVFDPCDSDPCGALANAVANTCTAVGASDFTCQCQDGYAWDGVNNQCASQTQGACNSLKSCLMACAYTDASCLVACQVAWTGCDCGAVDPANPPQDCVSECLPQCWPLPGQTCYECGVACVIDNHCE